MSGSTSELHLEPVQKIGDSKDKERTAEIIEKRGDEESERNERIEIRDGQKERERIENEIDLELELARLRAQERRQSRMLEEPMKKDTKRRNNNKVSHKENGIKTPINRTLPIDALKRQLLERKRKNNVLLNYRFSNGLSQVLLFNDLIVEDGTIFSNELLDERNNNHNSKTDKKQKIKLGVDESQT